jgi:hypothetical protein
VIRKCGVVREKEREERKEMRAQVKVRIEMSSQAKNVGLAQQRR